MNAPPDFKVPTSKLVAVMVLVLNATAIWAQPVGGEEVQFFRYERSVGSMWVTETLNGGVTQVRCGDRDGNPVVGTSPVETHWAASCIGCTVTFDEQVGFQNQTLTVTSTMKVNCASPTNGFARVISGAEFTFKVPLFPLFPLTELIVTEDGQTEPFNASSHVGGILLDTWGFAMQFDKSIPLSVGETTFTRTKTISFRPVRPFLWTGSVGNDYNDARNWNPNHRFPLSFDTAHFGSPAMVDATGAAAGRWIIAYDELDLNGSARVFSGHFDPTAPSLTLRDGGSLLLDNGSTFESFHAAVGTTDSAIPTRITVSGKNSLWKNTGEAVISEPFEAMLRIEKGGRVEAGRMELGKSAGTKGRVKVDGIHDDGTPSTLILQNGVLTVGGLGNNGAGTLLIQHGGQVETDILGIIRNQVSISGLNSSTLDGSILKSKSLMVIEGDLDTQLEVKDGGRLITGEARIGGLASTGKILVNNTASSLPPYQENQFPTGAAWLSTGRISLSGGNGPAVLIVEDNGVVKSTSNLVLGESGSEGKVTVSDGGSMTVAALTVGDDGKGALNIEAGGTVTSSSATVGSGDSSTSRGQVLIAGGVLSSANWLVNGDMTVGGGTVTGLGLLDLKGLVELSEFLSSATLTVTGQLTVGAS